MVISFVFSYKIILLFLLYFVLFCYTTVINVTVLIVIVQIINLVVTLKQVLYWSTNHIFSEQNYFFVYELNRRRESQLTIFTTFKGPPNQETRVSRSPLILSTNFLREISAQTNCMSKHDNYRCDFCVFMPAGI